MEPWEALLVAILIMIFIAIAVWIFTIDGNIPTIISHFLQTV